VAVAALSGEGELGRRGDSSRVFRWASVSKPVVALAALVAAEEGTIDLDEPAGPPGSTIRHLLAHTSGLPFEPGPPIAKPGTRRIYSNPGYEALAERLAVDAEMPFEEYLQKSVLSPLGMQAYHRGTPAGGLYGSLDDLVKVTREFMEPTLVAPETLAEATRVQFPGLAGVIPGLGRFDPNDWGLGFELKDGKQPHFTGTLTSSRTYGHWGASGTLFWVDPELDLALVLLTDLDFGDWAKEAWPAFSDAVVREQT
jgi:CubicO group peptidase (beta-lactamase class C family)